MLYAFTTFCWHGTRSFHAHKHSIVNPQELDISRETVELTEAVQELSQGQWEGRSRSEIYTSAVVPIMNSTQPDFQAPGGESQRQVEFRMIEFLNNVVILRASSTPLKARRQRESKEHVNKIQQASTLVSEHFQQS